MNIKSNTNAVTHTMWGGDVPYLHAPAPAAHVLPQQQVVESAGTDEVGELPEGLLAQTRGQSLLGQSAVNASQLPQYRRHGGDVPPHRPGV